MGDEASSIEGAKLLFQGNPSEIFQNTLKSYPSAATDADTSG